MNKYRHFALLRYICFDFLAAIAVWLLFYSYRKVYVEHLPFDVAWFSDIKLLYGVILIPLGWVLLYAIFDSYRDIYRMSRLSELFKTIFLSVIGVTFLFFVLILDDVVKGDKSNFYLSFIVLFSLQFLITAIFRMYWLTKASHELKNGKVGFRTLLIGGNKNAVELYKDITERPKKLGYFFTGFIDLNGDSTNELREFLPIMGKLGDLRQVIADNAIEEVIIAIETSEHNRIREIMTILYDFNNIVIKIIPDMYDIMLGNVKMNYLYGAVLIEISPELLPRWQRFLKRIMDLLGAGIVAVGLLPLFLFIALRVRLSSDGPIFYQQERIGKDGKPFMIFKYRSMFTDAEEKGPQLSSDDDPRITPWGKTMRKYRLDELPQVWNVLIGDMALVGPRPERQHFITLITARAPQYRQLLKVRPGITSWGMVKYGYASNVDEMIARMKFDTLYVENMSLGLDIKIIFYTILVLIQGKGK
jgi:exopolysaccharide biosynthesis polyprenyl glycosylphosphotransferase